MKFTIELDDDYQLPEEISNYTKQQWINLFQFISDLKLNDKKISIKMIEKELKRKICSEYETKIDDINSQLKEQNDKYTDLTKKYSALVNNHLSEITSLEKDLCKKLQNNHAEKINDIITKCKEEIEKYKVEYENLLSKKELEYKKKDKYELDNCKKDIEEYKNKIISLQQEKNSSLADLTSSHEKIIEQYTSRISLLEKIMDENKSQITTINKINDGVITLTKFYTGSADEKGILGEDIVRTYLSDKYIEAIVTDTSSKTAKGDILFKWRHMKCLLEIKNKKSLTIDDMSKFERDIKENNNIACINCGIFISLHTSAFPQRSKEHIQLDYIHNIPVFYIYLQQVQHIDYAILFLSLILQNKNNVNEQTERLLKYFIQLYNKLVEDIKDTNINIQTKQKEIRLLEKKLKLLTIEFENIQEDYLKYANDLSDIIVDSEQSQNTKVDQNVNLNNETNTVSNKSNDITDSNISDDDVKSILYKAVVYNLLNSKNIELPNISRQCAIPISRINKISDYKNIINMIKQKYTSEIIDGVVIGKILAFKKKHNHYPTRKDLINSYIISDSSLRKLNKIVCSKRIIDYISTYCEKNKHLAKVVNETENKSTKQNANTNPKLKTENNENNSDKDHTDNETSDNDESSDDHSDNESSNDEPIED